LRALASGPIFGSAKGRSLAAMRKWDPFSHAGAGPQGSGAPAYDDPLCGMWTLEPIGDGSVRLLLCQSNRIARTIAGPKRRRVFSNIEWRAGMMDANRIEECERGLKSETTISNRSIGRSGRKESNPRHTA